METKQTDQMQGNWSIPTKKAYIQYCIQFIITVLYTTNGTLNIISRQLQNYYMNSLAKQVQYAAKNLINMISKVDQNNSGILSTHYACISPQTVNCYLSDTQR